MYEVIDGPEPERCRELLADDLRFSIVFSTGEVAEDFAGGREAFDAYLAQRDAPAWTHHVLSESSDGARRARARRDPRRRLAAGDVRRRGARWTAAA